jgi:hypothetical protein
MAFLKICAALMVNVKLSYRVIKHKALNARGVVD